MKVSPSPGCPHHEGVPFTRVPVCYTIRSLCQCVTQYVPCVRLLHNTFLVSGCYTIHSLCPVVTQYVPCVRLLHSMFLVSGCYTVCSLCPCDPRLSCYCFACFQPAVRPITVGAVSLDSFNVSFTQDRPGCRS